MRAYFELLRPANVMTAVADVLAGFAVAGLGNRGALPWLILSTACLYGGGVVLNDVFDRDIDRRERPERPIPSGRVSAAGAVALGAGLLAGGTAAAWQATAVAGWIALAIAALVLIYDAWGKRSFAVGPVNMGLCRGLNLLLGVAAVPAALLRFWPVAFIPLAYIWAVTALSRGEVHGGRRAVATAALLVLGGAVLALAIFAVRTGQPSLAALALVAALAWRVLPPVAAARKDPSSAAIRRAVMRGVLSLVLLDAAIGATFAGPVYAAVILATGIAAGALARLFAVT